jgi:glyoxylase-like metal-dependent hydrolase (beta-lactamase superfamily II)
VLVDTAHCLHAEQTAALVQQALAGAAEREGRPPEPLVAVINTHLHSDHCGGNARLQREWPGLPVFVPSPSWDAVQAWDDARLSYRATAQRMERFAASGTVTPGEVLAIGERRWQVLAAPGHDPESVMLFDADHGVLISADALWENGFGVVFPELDGIDAFDAVGATLDLIASLPVRWVVPGHGAVFSDVAGALARARSRLAGLRADPSRHLRHAAKVLIKYHLLEEQRQTLAALQLWAGAAPLLRTIWERLDKPARSLHSWCEQLVDELAAAGAAGREGRWVVNR